MKHKNILLVANDNFEILNVQRELARNCGAHSLHVAKNGLDALALLMGCSSPLLENYSKTGKVQPDILLMDIDSPGLHMTELLCIMQKYYSLQKIKVFLIAGKPDKIDLKQIEDCAIEGILTKPLNFETNTPAVAKLQKALLADRQNAWFPLAGLPTFGTINKSLAEKFFELKSLFGGVSTTAGIKVAAICTVAIAGSVLSSSGETVIKEQAQPPIELNPPSVLTPAQEQVKPISPVPISIQKDKRSKTAEPVFVDEQPFVGTAAAGPEVMPSRAFKIHVVEEDAPPGNN